MPSQERAASLWREPVCCRGTTHAGWERSAGHPHDGRMVDALALAAEEGRGHAAKCPGEALAACDPGISEWGNPPGARPGTQERSWEGTGGTETSQYPEEQRGFP